jgi:hypothetical protein
MKLQVDVTLERTTQISDALEYVQDSIDYGGDRGFVQVNGENVGQFELLISQDEQTA